MVDIGLITQHRGCLHEFGCKERKRTVDGKTYFIGSCAGLNISSLLSGRGRQQNQGRHPTSAFREKLAYKQPEDV